MKIEITTRQAGIDPSSLAVEALRYAQEIAIADRDVESLIEIARGFSGIAHCDAEHEVQLREQARLDAEEKRVQEGWEADYDEDDVEEPLRVAA